MTIRASVSGAPMCSDVSSKSYIIPTSPETAKQPVRTPANTTKPNINGGRAKTTSQFSFNRNVHNNELKRLKWGFFSTKYTSVLTQALVNADNNYNIVQSLSFLIWMWNNGPGQCCHLVDQLFSANKIKAHARLENVWIEKSYTCMHTMLIMKFTARAHTLTLAYS